MSVASKHPNAAKAQRRQREYRVLTPSGVRRYDALDSAVAESRFFSSIRDRSEGRGCESPAAPRLLSGRKPQISHCRELDDGKAR